MSKYVEKNLELTILTPERKTEIFKRISNYKKLEEKDKEVFDSNADMLFEREIKVESNYKREVLRNLKQINLIIKVVFIFMIISVITQVVAVIIGFL